MDERHANPPLPPALFQVLTLGTCDTARWRQDITKASGGRAMGWSACADPDRSFGDLVPAGARADVAILRFSPGPQREAAVERWAWLAAQLGVPHCIMLVEKTDIPPQGRKGFDQLIANVVRFIKENCAFQDVAAVPVATPVGGNVAERDSSLGWYMGPILRDHLQRLEKSTSGQERGTIPTAAVASDHFQARLFWLDESPLIPWRPYRLETERGVEDAKITDIKYELDAHTHERIARNRLKQGDIGVCNVATSEPTDIVRYSDDRKAGLVRVRDLKSNGIVAYGLIDYSLRRATNVRWQETTVTPGERAAKKQQMASVLWFTGISGAGKSTIADLVEKRLTAAGKHTMLLDGDNVRHGLNKDLGFTDVDRVENIRRIAEVSKLMCDAGLIVLVSFISPFRAERSLARETVAEHGFHEIYIATALEDAEARDAKGLYAKARRGEIKNFTGIDSPYEPPEAPDITIDTKSETAEQAAKRIVSEVFGL